MATNLKKTAVLLAHALVIWVLCGATIGIGRSTATMEVTLIIHAIGAPIYAALVSTVYYRRFAYTTPAQTASIFLVFVLALDAGFVAPVLEGSYVMFGSILGTWIPFALIFLSTYLTGLFHRSSSGSR